MSRGHGRTQRHVLALLDQLERDEGAPDGYPEAVSVDSLARVPVGQCLEAESLYALPRAPRSRIESVRRACKRLAAEGLVELTYQRVEVGARVRLPADQRTYADDRAFCDYAERWLLYVRRSLSVDERQRLDAHQRLQRERARAKADAAIVQVLGGAA